MRSTIELLLDLVRQSRDLLLVELSLTRAELAERSSSISSGLSAVAVGLALLPIGLSLIFVATSLFIARFGVPVDLAFLIVAQQASSHSDSLRWTRHCIVGVGGDPKPLQTR